MKVVGISYSEGNGKRATTLHCLSAFDAYQDNPEAGRFCEGEKAEAIYVGNYECSDIEIGDDIEIYYGKAVTTQKGTFQPIALIRVLSES